jgi:hypothetical protein
MNKVISRIKSFALKVMGLFGYKPNHPNTLDEMLFEEAEEDPSYAQSYQAKQEENKKRRSKNPTLSFKKAILGDLKNYFYYIKKMKSADKEAYGFYSKMGANLVTNYAFDKEDIKHLPTRWKETRPSFGCIFTSIDAEDEKSVDSIAPAFMYFTKFDKSPAGVQIAPKGWDVYRATIYFHRTKDNRKSKINISLDYCVAIDENNEVKFLLSKTQDQVVIQSKRPAQNGHKTHYFCRNKWGIPNVYMEWAAEKGMKAEDLMVHLFKDMVNFYDASSYMGMVEIGVQRDNIKAKFCIQPQDAVTMFKDREKIGNSRKHIFHSVVPHTRVIKGVEKNIKLHFRGQRVFTWNGYSINISVPVRESVVWMPEIDIKSHSYDDDEEIPPNSLAFGAELADFISDVGNKHKPKYVS